MRFLSVFPREDVCHDARSVFRVLYDPRAYQAYPTDVATGEKRPVMGKELSSLCEESRWDASTGRVLREKSIFTLHCAERYEFSRA